jgi:hypothetical protein
MERPVELDQDPALIEHEQTYKAFNLLIRWSMVALGSALLMLTMWFATPAGFFAALITGIVVFALGYLFLVRQEEGAPLEPGP